MTLLEREEEGLRVMLLTGESLGGNLSADRGHTRMIYTFAPVSMYQYMSLAPIGCPQKASNVGCISVWRDRAFACVLASRTVRVRQHPGRGCGGFTYSEHRCFTMLAGHDLRLANTVKFRPHTGYSTSSVASARLWCWLQVSRETVCSRHVRPPRRGDPK